MFLTNTINSFISSILIKPFLFNFQVVDYVVVRMLCYVKQKFGVMTQQQQENNNRTSGVTVAFMTILLLVVEGVHYLLATVVDKMQHAIENVDRHQGGGTITIKEDNTGASSDTTNTNTTSPSSSFISDSKQY